MKVKHIFVLVWIAILISGIFDTETFVGEMTLWKAVKATAYLLTALIPFGFSLIWLDKNWNKKIFKK